MRILITMLVAVGLVFVLPMAGTAGATSFPDVSGHWAEPEITFLESEGLISGLPGGSFGVSASITRAQVAQLIATQQDLAAAAHAFPDVPAGHWATAAIGSVFDAGLMAGFPDGTFRPDDTLTRAQAATVLANAFAINGSPTTQQFPDVPTSHWAFASIENLVAEYLVSGYPDGTFLPDQSVTRAEFAVFLARVLEPQFRTTVELLSRTADVIQLLSEEDLAGFASEVHPVEGVRFSPYTFVEASHQVFSASALPGFLNDTSLYLWGTEDGTGDPIVKTPEDYFERFVMNTDYAQPDDIQYNNVVQRGSMFVNIPSFYPDAVFVEHYVAGTAQFGGLDWGSLYVVWEEYDGDWYVIALVHGEWTT